MVDFNLQHYPKHYAGYARVNANAPWRLTVSTFLASISFAVFAVFLQPAIHISGFNLDVALVVLSEILLGAASLFLLVVASVMSIVLTRFGQFSYNERKSLEEGKSIDLSNDAFTTLDKTIKLYDQSIAVMYWGILAVLVSLLLLGFHVNIIIGVLIVVAFFVVGIRLREFVRFILRSPR